MLAHFMDLVHATPMSPVYEPVISETIPSNSLDAFIKKKIVSDGLEDAFYVLDVASVDKLWKLWKSLLPRVKPFYAVKCNPNPQLISLLGKQGAGFDVASMSEVALAVKLGAPPKDIIFANPCKLPSHISFARTQGVNLTTFDSKGELHKLSKYHPCTQVLIRIRVDDESAKVPLGAKFGAEVYECLSLLELAKSLDVAVGGVSFHVGTGASDAKTFTYAIRRAREVFDIAASLGMQFTILDIGGGFVSEGGNGVMFATAAKEINQALDLHFPSEMDVNFIAEPGRYFAEEPFTLAANVFGCRFRAKGDNEAAAYWINDGIYGSMNCIIFDYAVLLPIRVIPIASRPDAETCDDIEEVFMSTIFGPTCDSIDTVLKNVWLPKLECGDWLVFSRMGAYTICAASSFNGFNIGNIQTFCVGTV